MASRRELLNRRRVIDEEEEENGENDPSKRLHLNQKKEEWFFDAFKLLICLPKETHIWCGCWDIMGPLLETFYNYFKDERQDSPLKLLWKRISEEMRCCIQCVSQHRQAQEMYEKEYEFSSIGPLLAVLQDLDEERVAQHLQEINARLAREKYDPLHDNAQVVCVMYEVLMFPILLDDQSLFIEFEKFIEVIDGLHELALDGHQNFPGVYALLFFNRRVRTIGFRLARSMGKLRRATDLEPLQPLLKKFIGFLETEGLPPAAQASRPRAQLERLSIWLGITSLLEFLEAPAFEDGILEHYPIFFDIVLNHVSGDSPEFSQAVSCLKELLKMLGCKLWLRSTLSPSVMRNTLLGQCFHTRNEQIHKVIFDLFQPFLQSLEALQDGEHEKQRRHFLYFLIHQVPASSNFSVLTRKIGCKIALLIILRGYQMNPPCPPFECAHMWCPALVSCLNDSSLHSSLRQPALDLVQTIVVSDAAALVTSVLNSSVPKRVGRNIYIELDDNEDNNLPFPQDIDETDSSSWNEFDTRNKIISGEYRGWMCIPMLWIDVLVDISPSILPVSFSKAVFWARSRLCLVEPENGGEMVLDVKSWLSSSVTEISATLAWKVPTGSDDGGGKESKNSVKVSTMCLPLIRTFKRLTTHFLTLMGQGELRKQWTWEPRMGESLILSLLDPNDNMRQFGKSMLEQASDTRGLACGLKFLCACHSSLSAVFMGVRHALKLVQLDSVLLNFQTLHHFLFVLCKLLKEGDTSQSGQPGNLSEGGFLRQPDFDSLPVNYDHHSSSVDLELRDKFCYFLSEAAWLPIRKCLTEGKAFIGNSLCQMTCVRLLEILPVLFEKLYNSHCKKAGTSKTTMEDVIDFKWLHDLIDWGVSELKVIVVYWKRTLSSLLNMFKGTCNNASVLAVRAIENLISCDSFHMDDLTEQVSRLCVSLSKEDYSNARKTTLRSSSSDGLPKHTTSVLQPPHMEDKDVQILDSVTLPNRREDITIIVSDDEIDKETSDNAFIQSNTVAPGDKSTYHIDSGKRSICSPVASEGLLGIFQKRHSAGSAGHASKKQDLDSSGAKKLDSVRSKGADGMKKETKTRQDLDESSLSLRRAGQKSATAESANSRNLNQVCKNMGTETKDKVLKELVCDPADDPLESALKSVKHQQPSLAKSGPFVLKRQVIQLKSPFGNKCGNLQRPGAGYKRFKPPRLEDWYRRILELDYFAIVGLASPKEDENKIVSKFEEVPVCFQSPEQYVNIFKPLVLEEFKAQLHSSFLERSSWEEMYCGSLSVLSVERVDDFHLVRFVHDDSDSTTSRSFAENDLVLLTKEHLQNINHNIYMIGKVERRERDDKRRASILLVRFYLQNGSLRLNQARRNLLERSKWHGSRVLSITPQIREFQALSSVKDIPILPIILKPANGSIHHCESREPDMNRLSPPLRQTLMLSFNKSQLRAISAAIEFSSTKRDFELSLIQGPPGTGKTRTIVAIVSGLLASSPQRSSDTEKSSDDHLKQRHGTSADSRPRISQSAAVARAWQDAALARKLHDDAERTKKSTETFARGRVLICAQSNAAVDELVSRISSAGLYGRDGKMCKPYLVRVGNVKTVHPNSLPFFIDTLVDQRLAEEKMRISDANNNFGLESSMSLRSNLEKLVDRIRFYEAKRANIKDGSSDKNSLQDETHKEYDVKEMSDAEFELKLRKLYEQKKQIYKDLSVVQVQERKANEEIRALRHKLRKSILREAQIVVTTLSGCGGDLYGVCSDSMSSYKFGSPAEYTLFDAVVIDEAAQALEPATLIPLQLLKSKGTKCIMVGDPKQLPATVLSSRASKFLYECSMFERLQRGGYPVVMLTHQYRMHPEICRFPSLHFYDSKLFDGEGMSSKSAPFHEISCLGPYVFYDIVDGQELRGKNSGASSLCNEHEAEAAIQLLSFFKKRYPSEFVGGRIGVITPYKSQLSVLRSGFISAFGSSVVSDMEFNTVDGFQGREVDILILSTVRAAGSCPAPPGVNSSNIGFVADVRRMNVALTRAKLSLWILGNARTLQTNYNWAALVKDAKDRNLIISVERPYSSILKGKNPALKSFGFHSKHFKYVEKADSQLAKHHKRRTKVTVERETKDVSPSSGIVAGGDMTLSSKRGDVQNKEKATEERGLSRKKNFSTMDACGENRTSNDVKSEGTKKHIADGETKGKNKGNNCHGKKGNLEDTNGQKKKKVAWDDSPTNLELDGAKGRESSFKCDRNKRSSEVSNTLSEGRHKDVEAKSGTASNQVGTSENLISKRKKQREAVDAILYSSLISSNKSEKSSKLLPPKRSLSPTSVVTGGIKPPKARKGATQDGFNVSTARNKS